MSMQNTEINSSGHSGLSSEKKVMSAFEHSQIVPHRVAAAVQKPIRMPPMFGVPCFCWCFGPRA